MTPNDKGTNQECPGGPTKGYLDKLTTPKGRAPGTSAPPNVKQERQRKRQRTLNEEFDAAK
jgi:hypothetical protein